MRKYFYHSFLALQTLVEYRINIFWKFSGLIVRTLILYLFWVAVLGTGYGRSNYTAVSIAAYYIAITFVGNFSGFDYREVSDDIRNGDLSRFLVKPENYFLVVFFNRLPDRLLTLLIYSAMFMVFFGRNLTEINFVSLGLILGVLMVSVLMNFFLGVAIGSLSFWFRKVHAFEALFWNIGGLFSGQFIPLDLLPVNLLAIANYLPFKYMVFFPAQIILGKPVDNIWQSIAIQTSWLLLLFLIMAMIWEKGVYEFEATGQ